MEPWENEPKVRPIPIEDGDAAPQNTSDLPGVRAANSQGTSETFPFAKQTPTPRLRRFRPWIPLAVSGVATAALLSVVALFGTVGFRDSPVAVPESSSPTTSAPTANDLPPTLAESIPGFTDRLTLLATDRKTIRTLVWDLSLRVPKTSVTLSNAAVRWNAASFDTGGRLVAAVSPSNSDGGGQEVRIGTRTSIEDVPRLQHVWSLQWHAVDVARLAFVHSVDSSFTLETAEVDFLTQTPQDPDVVAVFSEPPRIIRWDNDGFLLQMGNRTVALDPRGNQLWSADGWTHTAAPGFLPQIRETDEGVRWYLVDRETGGATSIADLGINDNAEVTEIVTSKNSNIFAAATHRKEATTITVGGLSLIAPVTAHLFEDVTPYQFTSDAAFLILKSPDSNDLTFLDWRAGTFHEIEVPTDDTVLAINVG